MYICKKLIQVNIIIENQILSPINIYAYYIHSHIIYIEKHDIYNKRTYRNRFIISSPNGPQLISIPLKKGKTKKLFNQVEISYDTNWIGRLGNTLKTAYGSSAFFEYFFIDLMNIFALKYKYLFELNNSLREYIFNILEIDIPVNFTNNYGKYDNSAYFDLRDKHLPSIDLNTPAKRKTYPSVFDYKSNTIQNPSIIDLIFNMGKYGIEILENYPSK